MSVELATTDELIDELLTRCKHGIIHLYDVPNSGENLQDGEVWTIKRYRGHLTMCIGLSVELQNFLIKDTPSDG